MTLDSSASKAVYAGNGSAVSFPFSFRVWDKSELLVQVTGPDGNISDVTASCSVSLTDDGGVVNYTPGGKALPAGYSLVILRNMPFLQNVDLLTGTRFDPDVIEEALDRATAERQQLLEKVSRAVVVPADSANPPEEFADQLFSARDEAAQYAGQAASSAAEARGHAAHTAEIKAAGLRELREEGDRQAARLDSLADIHGQTLGQEVELPSRLAFMASSMPNTSRPGTSTYSTP